MTFFLLFSLIIPTATSGTNFKISSVNFDEGQAIPEKHTCQGADISPQLHWTTPPIGTKSLVIIVDDPDAPDPKAPKMTWVHWVIYNIPPDINALQQDLQSLPKGSQPGYNDWKKTEYGGPCPPIGTHRYFHKIYALDTVLKFESPPTKSDLEIAMKAHILTQSQLIGNYKKTTTK